MNARAISQRKRSFARALAACAVSFGLVSMLGCGNTKLAKSFVLILPGPLQVGTGGSLVIYSETSPTGATWTITPDTGCSGSGCGTLTNPTTTSITYNGPDSIPGASATFTLTATSTADPSLSASEQFTIYPVAVQITGPSSSTVPPLTSAQFSATVAGDPTTDGVTWSVSGASCSGAGLGYANCGTLTNATANSVTYNAPAAPALETLTLTATSVAFPGTSASYTITVPKLNVYSYSQTTLPPALAGQPYSTTVQVTGNTPPYTFTAVNLPSWATLAPVSPATGTSFTISGMPPAGTQGASFVQINISDSATPPDMASEDFTITVYPAPATGNNLLNGSYAFNATGWLDGTVGSTGENAYQGISYIGSFTADGNGNITAGEMDVNNFQTGLTSYASLSGTYNIQYAEDSNGNQLANFQTGYITLLPPGNVYPITLAVTFRGIQHQPVIPPATSPVLSTDLATAGDFIEFDDTTGDGNPVTATSSGQRMAGTLQLQNPSVLQQTTSPFQGNFAFGMNGNTSQAATNAACFSTAPPTCGPISLAGVFAISSAGAISSGEEDVMVASNYTAAVPSSLTGSFANNGGTDSYGRMAASISNSAISTTEVGWPSNYIAYAVDAQHFYFMSSDSFQTYSNLIGTATYQQPEVATTPFSSSDPIVLASTVTSTQYFTGGNGPNGKVRTQIQEFTPTLAESGCTSTQYGLRGPQYQNLSGSITTVAVGSTGNFCNTVSANGRVQPALNSTGEAEPILYLTDTNTGYGTQWNTGSGPGTWVALSNTASSLNAGNYSGALLSPTSIVGPLEVDILTLPAGGVPSGSATAVPVTGTDFSQFSTDIDPYSNSGGGLYVGPITGTMVNNESYADNGVTYTGIFLKGKINLGPADFQACTSGFGFVISSTSFVCIDTVDEYSTPHLFQQ